VRILIRLLSCVVLGCAAVIAWTRAGLVVALGPGLTAVCLWVAAGGSLCAVVTLARTRKARTRRQRPPRGRAAPPGAIPRRAGRRAG
jgi:hypothetical protein